MPTTKVVLYREDDGTVPLLEWLESLPPKVREKCLFRIQRLAELGHELRRPEADLLRDGIHELRVGFRGRNHRMLYFFFGRLIVVISHGLEKEARVPPKTIDLAMERRRRFEADPVLHTYEAEV